MITDNEWTFLAVLTLLFALASLVADAILIYRARAGDNGKQRTTSRRHVIAIASADVVACMGFLLGAVERLGEQGEMSTGSMCTLHGVLTMGADLMTVLYTLALTHGIYLLVQGGERKASAAVLRQHAGVIGLTVLLTALALAGVGGVEFKPELVWCSVGARPRFGPLLLFFVWILAAHASMVVLALLAKQSIMKTAGAAGGASKGIRGAVRTFMSFPAAVHVVWTPAYMLVVSQLVEAREPVFVMVLMNLFRALKGVIMLGLCRKVVAAKPKQRHRAPPTKVYAASEDDEPNDASPSPKAQTMNQPMLSPVARLLLKCFVGTVLCMLCLGMATAGVAYARRYSHVALREARDTTVRGVTVSANNEVTGFLAGPTQIKATLEYNAASSSQLDLDDRHTWETLIAPFFMSEEKLLAIYSATATRQVYKVHRETTGYLCTQQRIWTPLQNEYRNTTRIDMCRPTDGDFWGTADFYDDATGEYIDPSFIRYDKFYDPFLKSWFLQANQSEYDADYVHWNGPVFQSYTAEGSTTLDPVLEMVFRVEWPNLEPNRHFNGGTYFHRTNHKFKFATNELNAVMASLNVGTHGSVYIINDAGEIVAAPRIDEQLHTDDEGATSFYHIWELGGELAGVPYSVSYSDDDGAEAEYYVEPDFVVEGDDYQISVQQLDEVPSWRLVVITHDEDFLQESAALYDDMQVYTMLGTTTVLLLMWKAFFDLKLDQVGSSSAAPATTPGGSKPRKVGSSSSSSNGPPPAVPKLGPLPPIRSPQSGSAGSMVYDSKSPKPLPPLAASPSPLPSPTPEAQAEEGKQA